MKKRKSLTQKAGLAEDALYYMAMPYGSEEGLEALPDPDPDGGDHEPDDGTTPEPGPGTDPLDPDRPGDPNDPGSPHYIPDLPEEVNKPDKKGSMKEQLPTPPGTPLPPSGIVPPGPANDLPGVSKTQKPGSIPGIAWDDSYDVIVWGFDLAGAASALTAAENGAKVLLIDKVSPADIGSYTKDTAQTMVYARDKDSFGQFVRAWNQGYEHVDDPVIDAYVRGAERLPHWLSSHGGEIFELPHIQYDELVGSSGAGLIRLSADKSYDRALWKLVLNAMKPYDHRQIFFLSETQIDELIQDPESRTVLGVRVKGKNGKTLNFEARGGVILAGGGFENNEEMIENYLLMPSATSKYAKFNDGEAVKLAMRAGADLWHMDNAAGFELHLKDPLSKLQYRNPLQGLKQYQLGGRSCFVVGPDGRRFTDEGATLRSGHVYEAGARHRQTIPAEAWAIMDEKGLTVMPLAQKFSSDNLKEVADGRILKADTLDELARLLNIDAEALEQQFEEYQTYCLQGEDPQFGRRSENLFSLDANGPYYAVPLSPILRNTLGGPKRNEACEILDTKGEVISHLFGAGSLGSIFPNIYPEGADMTEALVSAQIAGANAASLAGFPQKQGAK